MAGFARVHEHGWRARRGQCGGNFVADMSTFPHAHDDHTATAIQNGLHHLHKPLVQALRDGMHRLRFNGQRFAGNCQGV